MLDAGYLKMSQLNENVGYLYGDVGSFLVERSGRLQADYGEIEPPKELFVTSSR